MVGPSNTSPLKQTSRQHHLRVRVDKARPRGGVRRGYSDNTLLKRRRYGPDCRDLGTKTSNGLRFPRAIATPAQDRELRKIVVDFVRRMTPHRFSGFSRDLSRSDQTR
jgi:hypothetical protein